MHSISALFPRTRLNILAATCLHPDRWWYLSDLAGHLEVSPSSLQRELASLVAAGVLRRRRDGNRVYFQPDPACPFLEDLQGLMLKTAGLVDVLREVLEPLTDRIAWAFVFGSIARGEELGTSDVDLMIIGDTGSLALAGPLHMAEERLQRSVNPVVYRRREMIERFAAANPFVREIVAGPKLYVVGAGDDLDAALGSGAGPPAGDVS